jgi:GNAT superfamily N-acetyltransferase
MTDNPNPPSGTQANLDVQLMEPAELDAVAELLADATSEGTVEAARNALESHQQAQGAAIFIVTLAGDLIGAYIMAPAQMSVEVVLFAVRKDMRRRGLGRIIMQDALRRAGHRPMVVETGEATMPFFTAIGFKKFGRRNGPNGEVRYRVGWHTPGQRMPTGAEQQNERS